MEATLSQLLQLDNAELQKSLSPTLRFIHYEVEPYILMVVVLAAALLNPKIEEFNIFQAAVPYIFIIALLTWIVSLSTWNVYLALKRKWHIIVWRTIRDTAKTTWTTLKSLGQFYIIKTFVGITIFVTLLLSVQWLYYHFNIWSIISSTLSFIKRVWSVLFKLNELVAMVHEYTNSGAIKTLHIVLDYAQLIVKENAVFGAMLIIALVAAVIVIVILVKLVIAYLKQEEGQAHTSTNTTDSLATDNSEVTPPQQRRRRSPPRY